MTFIFISVYIHLTCPKKNRKNDRVVVVGKRGLIVPHRLFLFSECLIIKPEIL